jgi:hypothetical protein
MGLCPLHADRKPSFLVDPNKNLFYCYGCGRGGDVIRFAELYHQVKFPQALALLHQWRGLPPLLHEAAGFLSHAATPPRRGHCLSASTRNPLAGTDRAHADRLRARRLPAGWLTQLGYPLQALHQAGLVTAVATTPTRIASCFRWRAISMAAACRSRRRLTVSAGRQGRLVRLGASPAVSEVILVEGLFDYAVLWQAGFHNVTCSMGNHLNAAVSPTVRWSANRLSGLRCRRERQRPAGGAVACRRLREQGVNVRRVSLPDGHDPNSFFVEGRRCAPVPVTAGGSSAMTFRVNHQPSANPARCPYRVVVQTTGREIDWINQYLDYETFAASPIVPCKVMRTSCCTFSAGGRVFIAPTRSPKMPSPNRHCSTMCDSSPVNNRRCPAHHQHTRCHCR